MTHRFLGAVPLVLWLLAGPAGAQPMGTGTAMGSPGTAAAGRVPATAPGAPAPAGLPSPSPFPGGLPSPHAFPGGLPSPQPYPAGIPSSVITPPGAPQPGTGLVPELAPAEPVPAMGVTGGGGPGDRGGQQPAPAGPWSAAAIEQSFMAADANGDGELSRSEAAALRIAPLPFHEMDLNRDGVLTRFEYATALTGR
jgi:hypothetical protein